MHASSVTTERLRRTVLLVAGLNLGYFFVEVAVALAIGSVSLFADGVDFLEDTAVNLLIVVALGWTAHRQALMGKVMAGIILVPAGAALWQAVAKLTDPTPPDPVSLGVTAIGAIVVNTVCALLLARMRAHGSSMSHAAYLAARNDVVANALIIAVAGITAWTASGWPDIVLGLVIVLLNGTAAKEVWEVAEEERLAAKALAGEEVD